ncbi:class I SAM-dependent methyltransferase [Radicibacter daui]|uniref:class I SAM-dependent methyltransferase n=1 Tax=Radicibacter daui TaxID=3064829 RepID=UPI0040469F82
MSDQATDVEFTEVEVPLPASQERALPDLPAFLFDRLARDRDLARAGQRVLQLATHSGRLARGFAARGCYVTAIGPDEAQLDLAGRRDRELDVYVDYRVGSGPEAQDEGAYDLVCTGARWDGLTPEGALSAQLARRSLVETGCLAAVAVTPLALPGSFAERASLLESRRRPGWPGAPTGITPEWLDSLHAAGFVAVRGEAVDFMMPVARKLLPALLSSWMGVGLESAASAVAGVQDGKERDEVPMRLWLVSGRRG